MVKIYWNIVQIDKILDSDYGELRFDLPQNFNKGL